MATTKKKRVVKRRATPKRATRKTATRKAAKSVKTAARRKTARKTKKGAKKKRSLLYSIKTCSGSGYYLRVSKDGRIRSVAGKGLRCNCPSASRPGCHTKRKK